MSTTDSLAVVRRYAEEVWDPSNPFDPDVLRRYFSPSLKRYTSAVSPPLDPEAQIARLQGIRTAFPDVTIVADDYVAEGDTVVVRATLRGTHRGEFLGIPATGRPVQATIVDFIRIEDGLIAEQWGGPDVFDMLRQIGVTFTARDD